MSEGFTCRGCGNLFFQAPKCVSCGAQKLYDSTVKGQWREIEAQAARIAKLEAAIHQYVNHVVSYEGTSFIDEMNEPPWAKLINDTWEKQATLTGGEKMGDDLAKRLRATTDGATVNPDGPAAADRIAELEGRLQEATSLLLQAHDHIFRLHENNDIAARNLITKIRLGFSGTLKGSTK